MSAERKKLIWIGISLCAFVLILSLAAFFLLTPKKGGALAPATIGNSAPPKAQDPQDYLSAPPPAPTLEQPRNQDGGMIIVYGDKPSLPAAAAGAQRPADSATPSPAATPAAPAASTKDAAEKAAQSAAKAAAAPVAGQKTALAAKAMSAAPAKAAEYWIQAASFTSRGRADELKQGLAEKGIAALISVKDISGKSYYRVRIGPYSVKAEADDWLSRLKGLPGSAEAYVSKSVAQQKAKK